VLDFVVLTVVLCNLKFQVNILSFFFAVGMYNFTSVVFMICFLFDVDMRLFCFQHLGT